MDEIQQTAGIGELDTKIKGPFQAAFPYTIPVMTGYLFMGMAFGILLQSQGYNYLWALLMSFTIFAGAMQFVAVGILSDPFSPLNVFSLTLMVNARHVFYGFSMLDRFKGCGKAKPYLIFGLTDETFSLLCVTEPPPGVSRGGFYFALTLLNHLYWISGCVIGALLGVRLTFNPKGIDFVMTALFVAIIVEQWRLPRNRLPVLVGFFSAALCLVIFGPNRFILPSMGFLVLLLSLGRGFMERRLGE